MYCDAGRSNWPQRGAGQLTRLLQAAWTQWQSVLGPQVRGRGCHPASLSLSDSVAVSSRASCPSPGPGAGRVIQLGSQIVDCPRAVGYLVSSVLLIVISPVLLAVALLVLLIVKSPVLLATW